jgi:hypothetical protein
LNAVMNLRVPQNVRYFLTSRGPCSFPRKVLLHGVELVILELPTVIPHSLFCITLPYLNLESDTSSVVSYCVCTSLPNTFPTVAGILKLAFFKCKFCFECFVSYTLTSELFLPVPPNWTVRCCTVVTNNRHSVSLD